MDVSMESAALRLLDQALALPADTREAWLDSLEQTPDVVSRLRELLIASGESGEFLERPAGERLAGIEAPLPHDGERLGAWRIVRELDRGGMGVVYLALRDDGAYEQRAAIKLIRCDELLDPEQRAEIIARFENERRLLARLDHPNVARILDGGQTDSGQPYLAMEFVDGPSLLVHCDETGLDVPARIALFCKVCTGVQAAHRHLIVHRDLKPQNILVGADGQPRLLDFGIARVLEHDSDADTRTQTRFVAMTPAYASPEQLRREPPTTASDIYSLGVILFELLAGIRPYKIESLTPWQGERLISTGGRSPLRRALLEAPLPDAERRSRLARIGPDLERIIAKAMHVEATRRYDTAQALADDLQRHLRGQPVLAHPDSLGYRLGKFVRRHRLGTVAAVLALSAILAASSAAFLQAGQARRAAQDMSLVNSFLLDVLNVSNPFSSGSELTLGEALDEAVGKIDERFGDRPELAVDIRNTLGGALQARFRTDAAEQQFERALRDGERLYGHDDARVLKSLNGLAAVRKDQNRMDEAQTLYEEILRRIEDSGQTHLPTYVAALNDLGVLLLTMEHYERAVGYLQRSLDAMAEVEAGEDEDLMVENRSLTLISLAQGYRALGNLERAEVLYDEAQQVLEQLYPDGAPQLAVLLNSRARLAQERGDYDTAITIQQRSIEMLQQSFRGDHVLTLVAMVNLARQALAIENLSLAEESAVPAADMADRLYSAGPPHQYHVYALSTLAAVRMKQGRRDDASTVLSWARDLIARMDSIPRSTSDRVAQLIGELCADRAAVTLPVCR